MKLTKDSKIIFNFINNLEFINIPKFKNNKNLKKIYYIFRNEYKNIKKFKIQINETKNNDIYLNNINSCNNLNKENFKSNLVKIIVLLKTKYNDLLLNIIQNINDFNLKKSIINFIENIEKLKEKDIIDFMNYDGIILSRYLYIYLLEKRMPNEILDIVGDDIEIHGEFTSYDINNDIELNLGKKKVYNIELNNINLNLTIHSKKNFNLKNKKKLLYRIFFLNNIYKNPNIHIKLWLSNIKKNINFNNKYIGAKEINTACTTFTGSKPNKISLWRKEELGKVLLHEIIHSLELENHTDLNFLNYFDIQNNITIRAFESYVEVIAQILNLIISVQEYNSKKSKKLGNKKITKKNIKYTKFLEFLNSEIIWSYFQCGKILNFYGYSRFEDFYSKDGFNNKTNKFNQKSNVFSYVVLRSIIYYNLGGFLNLLFKYNKNNILEDNIPTDEKIKFFINSLEKNNNEYIKIINYFININKAKKNEMIYKTMRLSVIETKIL